MEWIVSATTLFVCAVAARWLFLQVKNSNGNGKAIVYGVLGAIALIAAYKLLNPIVNVYLAFQNAFTTITGMSTIWGGLFGLGMITLLFVGAPHWLIGLFGISSPWKRFVFRATSAVFAVAATLRIFGSNVEEMTYVILMLAVASTISAGYIVYYWRRGIQDSWAIIAGYLLCVAMTTTMCWAILGINIFSNMSGSPETLAIIVVSQVALIAISNVLSLAIFFKKRLSYKIIYVWTVVLIVYSFGWMILMLTGYTNKYEAMAVRQVNQARRVENAIQRMISFGTERAGYRHNEASTLLKTAEESGNLEQVQKALASSEEHLRAQRKLPKASLEFPSGTGEALNDLGRIKDSLPLIGKKADPPPPPPPPKLHTESHVFLKTGEFWESGWDFLPGKLKIVIEGGSIEKVQSDVYRDPFPSGTHIVPNYTKGRTKFFSKSNQPTRITIVQISIDS
jgi:hypothetical protein